MADLLQISVVIPVYNNAKSLIDLSTRLVNIFKKIEISFELIYIDDGSRDNSLEILKNISNDNTNIKVIELSRNYGQHPAICAGFEHAKGQFIVLMDADLQDKPEHIESLYNKIIETGTDVVYTVKLSDSNKRFSSKLYHYFFSKIVNTSVPKHIGTLRIFNRNFLNGLLSFKEINILYGPLMFYMGYKNTFIELTYDARQHGKSSYTFVKRLKLATNSLISYTDIPHKIAIFLGIIIFIFIFLYALLVLFQYYLVGTSLPNGITLILLILFFSLGCILIMLGIIGSYVFRVYQEVLRRPRYIIRDTINLRKN